MGKWSVVDWSVVGVSMFGGFNKTIFLLGTICKFL